MTFFLVISDLMTLASQDYFLTARRNLTTFLLNLVCYVLLAKYLSLADIMILVVLLNVMVGYGKLLVWVWVCLSLCVELSFWIGVLFDIVSVAVFFVIQGEVAVGYVLVQVVLSVLMVLLWSTAAASDQYWVWLLAFKVGGGCGLLMITWLYRYLLDTKHVLVALVSVGYGLVLLLKRTAVKVCENTVLSLALFSTLSIGLTGILGIVGIVYGSWFVALLTFSNAFLEMGVVGLMWLSVLLIFLTFKHSNGGEQCEFK